MPRFVILTHDWPTPHWDFLLEGGPVLKAWRLLQEPAANTPLTAEANFDHRMLYLDYEGPISNDRGHVRQWDAGHFEWLDQGTDTLKFTLQGRRLQGHVEMRCLAEGWRWHFTPAAS